MATAKKKDDSNTTSKPSKIIDVAKPGETAPDASSRPLIVGHGAMIKQDPMVVDPEKSEEKSETPETPLAQKSSVKIEPPAEEETPAEEPSEVSEPAEPEAPATDETPPGETPESESVPEESAEDSLGEETGSGAVSALANEVGSKRKAEKEEADNKARIEEVQKLIRSKKYQVPIGELHGHHIVRDLIVLFILLLLLAAIGVNFAIDADKLDIGIKPLTNLL